MRKLAFLCLSLVGLASFGADARAEDDSLRTPTVHRVRTRYFTDTLLCDLGAVSLLGIGASLSGGNHPTAANLVFASSAVTYGIGAPIAHLARGRPWVALGDFALRAVVVAIPTLWGIPYVRREERAGGDPIAGSEAFMTVAAATILTGGAVTAVDAAVMAKQTTFVVDEPSASWKPAFRPGFAIVRGGATAGLRGTF